MSNSFCYLVVLNLCYSDAFELQLPETPVSTAGGKASGSCSPKLLRNPRLRTSALNKTQISSKSFAVITLANQIAPIQLSCDSSLRVLLLSPMLFNTYTKPLVEAVHCVGVHRQQYVDDIQLSLSFSPKCISVPDLYL